MVPCFIPDSPHPLLVLKSWNKRAFTIYGLTGVVFAGVPGQGVEEISFSLADSKELIIFCSCLNKVGSKRFKTPVHRNHSKSFFREFPGSPVVRIQCFHCWGPGSSPGRGTKITQALRCGQKTHTHTHTHTQTSTGFPAFF